MCGLAGILEFGNVAVSKGDLSSMISQLNHRGPDSCGFYLNNNIGFSHARLSIIDLEGGDQPIFNETKTVATVFNGEIFNYVELRDQLQNKGHRFYTKTDTEVIVHLYEEYGESFVNHLNGQFAIAIWDTVLEKLILVRDRVGIVPLFYTMNNTRFLFASEVKAMLPVLDHSPTLNITALDQLMTFWSPVSPATMFSGINEVSPGECIIVKDGKIRKYSYWDWQFPEEDEYLSDDEDVLKDQLKELLIDATQIRLRSDVPVGAYLSGGLDSSVLVSLIKNYTDSPLRTFSIGFEDKGLDETDFQQSLINHLHASHSQIICGGQDISNNFVDTIWHTEQPVLRSAPVPMGMLSGLVHQMGYKVVLTGEGADEVLGGYDIFKENKIRQFWARSPDSKWRPTLLKRLYPYLDISPGRAQAYLQNFFGTGLQTPDLLYFSHMPRWQTTAKCKDFYSKGMVEALKEVNTLDSIVASIPDSINKVHYFNKAQYIESKSLMAGYLLCSQGDRMLMKNSVEGRFPFLDHRVIEFANKLHPKFKMKVLNEKYLLKQSMKSLVPKDIVNRHKQPYRAPDIPSFINSNTPEYVNDLLSAEQLNKYGYFDANKVSLLLRKIKAGRAIGFKDNMAFMSVLSTQVWHYLFIEKGRRNSGLN